MSFILISCCSLWIDRRCQLELWYRSIACLVRCCRFRLEFQFDSQLYVVRELLIMLIIRQLCREPLIRRMSKGLSKHQGISVWQKRGEVWWSYVPSTNSQWGTELIGCVLSCQFLQLNWIELNWTGKSSPDVEFLLYLL